MDCDNCGKEIKALFAYAGQDDLVGIKIPPGQFCCTQCLSAYISSVIKEGK